MEITAGGILASHVVHVFNNNGLFFFIRCLGSQKVMSQYARFAREAASEVILRRKIHVILCLCIDQARV